MGFQMEESSVPQDHREECCLIYYGDIHAFAVAKRVGQHGYNPSVTSAAYRQRYGFAIR
jgi:hypothetical protein